MIISRPMKPYKMSLEELNHIVFPVYGTPKIDGIRCTKINGKALTATHKPIPNIYIRNLIEFSSLPNGFDGELKTPGTFQETVSAVMSVDGTPPICWQIFDYISDSSYIERMEHLRLWFLSSRCAFAQPVLPDIIRNHDELIQFNDAGLEEGYEGTCYRTPGGRYKNGRSTFREQLLLAIKPFVDAEATVLGMAELLKNNNTAEVSELGLTHRCHISANKEGLNMMGALLVMNSEGVRFKVGTGFTQDQRMYYWSHAEEIVGKVITYKSMPYGAKNAPRHPVFKAIRGTNELKQNL